MRGRGGTYRPQELQLWRKYEHSLILGIGDDDAPIIVARNSGRTAELMHGRAFVTFGGENLRGEEKGSIDVLAEN